MSLGGPSAESRAVGGASRQDIAARSGNLRAAGYTLIAVTLFSVSDALVKLLAAAYPTGQIVACRGALCTALLWLAMAAPRRGGGRRLGGGALAALGVLRDPACVVRAVLDVAVTFCFIAALGRLPIAEASATLFVFPLLLTALAALVLREPVGPRRWAAIMAGLAGVLLVLRPGFAAFDPAMLLALAAAFGIAGRDLATRFVRPGSASGAVALTNTGLATLAGLPTFLTGSWRPVDAAGLLGLAATAALGAVAFAAMVEGTRAGEVSFTAPFRYVAIPLAFAAGWLVWGQVPDRYVVLGSAIVVGSGLFVLHRERASA